MSLPAAYAWLEKEPGPRMLREALRLHGTIEAPGAADNPEILGWAREVGVTYRHDATAWCGLAMAVVAKRAGKPIPRAPLWALNWGAWGKPATRPELGCVLVFRRVLAFCGPRGAAVRWAGYHLTPEVVDAEGKVTREAGHVPTKKPHGRLAWSIHFDNGLYLDVSVMPRSA